MNKNSIIGSLATLMLLMSVACKKNNLWVDQDSMAPPEAGQFLRSALSADFYIENNAAGGSTFKLPVGITTVSSVDRTVSLTYTSRTAVQGTHYKGPTTLTIPAGKVIDTLSFQGLFAAYPTGRKDTVIVRISSDGGGIKKAGFNDTFRIIMQKYCTVSLPALGGAYTKTFEGTYGPYTSNVLNLTSTGATTATAVIDNIYDSGIEANVVFNWTNPAAFTVTIPDQSTGFTSGGNDLRIRGTVGQTSGFSSCDNTITLRLQLYTVVAGAISDYATWTTSMAK